jgi:hypothetical protein
MVLLFLKHTQISSFIFLQTWIECLTQRVGKMFFSRAKGGILVFTIVSITMLITAVLALQRRTMYENIFYEKAVRSFGFFDKNGQLHGLGEVETESMKNLAMGVMYKLQNTSDEVFHTEITGPFGDSREVELPDIDADELDLADLLNKANIMGLTAQNVKHNSPAKVNLSNIKIKIADNKLPFNSNKFEKELNELLNLVLLKYQVTDGEINDLKKDLKGKKDKLNNVDDFKFFLEKHKVTEGKNDLIDCLTKSISFDPEVTAVNFFLANRYVKKAICCAFYDRYNKSPSPKIPQPPGLNKTPDSEPFKLSKDFLDEMLKWDLAPDLADKYRISDDKDKHKILMSNGGGSYHSYSAFVEVTIEVEDDEIGTSTHKFICDLRR